MKFKVFFKAAFVGLILSVSGFAKAGLIIDIYDNGSGLTEIKLSGSDLALAGSQNITNGFWLNDISLLNIGTSASTFTILESLSFFTTTDGINTNLSDVYTSINSSCCAFGFRMADGVFSVSAGDIISLSGRLLVNKLFTDWKAGTYQYTSYSAYNDNSSRTFLRDGLTVNIGDVSQVPEPSTLAILALSLIGLASRRFKKRF